MGKRSDYDFLELDEFYEVKVGTCQINEYMTIYDYQGQGYSLAFVEGHRDSTFSKLLFVRNRQAD